MSRNVSAVLMIVVATLLSSCGSGGGSSSGNGPGGSLFPMTGDWRGTFEEDFGANYSVSFTVTNQQGNHFSGSSWGLVDEFNLPVAGGDIVEGRLSEGNDDAVLVDLTLSTSQTREVCAPIFGCFICEIHEMRMFGSLVNNRFIDPDAKRVTLCSSSDSGEMTIFR